MAALMMAILCLPRDHNFLQNFMMSGLCVMAVIAGWYNVLRNVLEQIFEIRDLSFN